MQSAAESLNLDLERAVSDVRRLPNSPSSRDIRAAKAMCSQNWLQPFSDEFKTNMTSLISGMDEREIRLVSTTLCIAFLAGKLELSATQRSFEEMVSCSDKNATYLADLLCMQSRNPMIAAGQGRDGTEADGNLVAWMGKIHAEAIFFMDNPAPALGLAASTGHIGILEAVIACQSSVEQGESYPLIPVVRSRTPREQDSVGRYLKCGTAIPREVRTLVDHSLAQTRSVRPVGVVSPLVLAVRAGSPESVVALIRAGQTHDPDIRWSPLHEAAWRDDVPCLQALLAQPAASATMPLPWASQARPLPPLVVAASRGSTRVLAVMIDQMLAFLHGEEPIMADSGRSGAASGGGGARWAAGPPAAYLRPVARRPLGPPAKAEEKDQPPDAIDEKYEHLADAQYLGVKKHATPTDCTFEAMRRAIRFNRPAALRLLLRACEAPWHDRPPPTEMVEAKRMLQNWVPEGCREYRWKWPKPERWELASRDVGIANQCIDIFRILLRRGFRNLPRKLVEALLDDYMSGAIAAIAGDPETGPFVLGLPFEERRGVDANVSCAMARGLGKHPASVWRELKWSVDGVLVDTVNGYAESFARVPGDTSYDRLRSRSRYDIDGKVIPMRTLNATSQSIAAYWPIALRRRIRELATHPLCSLSANSSSDLADHLDEERCESRLDLSQKLIDALQSSYRANTRLHILAELLRCDWAPGLIGLHHEEAGADEVTHAYGMSLSSSIFNRPSAGALCALLLRSGLELSRILYSGWFGKSHRNVPMSEATPQLWQNVTSRPWRQTALNRIVQEAKQGAATNATRRLAGVLLESTEVRRWLQEAGGVVTHRQAALLRWRSAIAAASAPEQVWGFALGFRAEALGRALRGPSKAACLAVRGSLPVRRDGEESHESDKMGRHESGAAGDAMPLRTGCTLLMAAASVASIECVKVLLDAGAPCLERDDCRKDALWWSQRAGSGRQADQCVQILRHWSHREKMVAEGRQYLERGLMQAEEAASIDMAHSACESADL